MKLDSETLIKHRFWFLAGVTVLPVAIALFVLMGPVPGKINAQKQKIEMEIKKVKNFSDPKRPEDVKLKEKEAANYGKLKSKVWEAAWKKQESLSTWPEEVEKTYHFKNGLFVLKIQADRTKGAAEPTTTETDKNKKAGPIGDFKGTIERAEKEWISVRGLEGKNKVTKRFERTKEVEVTLDDDKEKGKKVEFGKLLPGDRVAITYQVGKYFGDELTPPQLETFKNSYKTQLPDILKSVDPVDAEGHGIVQLKGWPFEDDPDKIPAGAGFLVFHGGEWQDNRYLSKEAWTAQEDVWIQREIYRLIAQANKLVSQFKPDLEHPGVFVNPYWELKLALTKDKKLQGTIKNRLHRRQKADVWFRVTVRPNAEPAKVFVGGLPPLNPLEEKEITLPLKINGEPTGIYAVEQILTPETAAVRRIDVLAIGGGQGTPSKMGLGMPTAPLTGLPAPTPAGDKKGSAGPTGLGVGGGTAAKGSLAQSNRTFIKELKAYHFPGDPKEAEGGESKESTTPTMPTGVPAGAASMYGKQPMQPGGATLPTTGGAAASKTSGPSKNGFVFERYLRVDKEARRVPVCVVLIVDQQHVGLVEAAFADSKLRFLTNQVLVNRYPFNVRLPETSLASAGKPGTPAGPSGLPFPGGSGFPGSGGLKLPTMPAMPKMPYGAGSGYFPGPRGGGAFMPAMGYQGPGSLGTGEPTGPSGAAGSDEQEANIELVIYGVVTLYERYPPRPTTTDNGS